MKWDSQEDIEISSHPYYEGVSNYQKRYKHLQQATVICENANNYSDLYNYRLLSSNNTALEWFIKFRNWSGRGASLWKLKTFYQLQQPDFLSDRLAASSLTTTTPLPPLPVETAPIPPLCILASSWVSETWSIPWKQNILMKQTVDW